jgi:hypothetical protein
MVCWLWGVIGRRTARPRLQSALLWLFVAGAAADGADCMAGDQSKLRASGGPADSVDFPDLTRVPPILGINVRKAANFWRHWHLVTTRYRKDNGEQRFIFANDIAWSAMERRAKRYPDGAMFGKIAFATGRDEAFPNSVEPTRTTRVQLMVKNATKYKEFDGWGYAIPSAHPVSGNRQRDHDDAAACHGCHKLVPERDFVFSRSTFLGRAGVTATDVPSANFRGSFRRVETKEYSPLTLEALRLSKNSDASVLMYASMMLFSGSMQESIGPLADYVRQDQTPYLLADETQQQFILVKPLQNDSMCRTAEQVISVLTVKLTAEDRPEARPFRSLTTGRVCNGSYEQIDVQQLPQ